MGFKSFASYGSQVSFKTIIVAPPTNLVLSEVGRGLGNASITFTLSPNATSYDVYSSLSGAGYVLASSTVSGNTASITGLIAGNKYKFEMTAFKGVVASPYSTASNSITLTDPPVLVTPLTTKFNSNTITISGNSGIYDYQNGSYTTSSSSFLDGNWQAYKAFINGQDGFPSWLSGGSNKYNGSDGVYNGSTSTVANGTSLLGEWVQIVLPYELSLISYQLSSKNSYYLGVSWYILGSNDGTTWALLDTRTNPSTYWTSMPSDTIVTFDAVSKIKYNTFRMVVSSTGASSVASVTGLNYIGFPPPPPLQVTPLTTKFNSNTITISGNNDELAYQNGSYTTSSSSFYDRNWQAYKAYNNGQDGFPSWLSGNSNQYSGSDGVYNGSTSTVANGTSLLGEWVQIVLPYGLSLVKYKLSSKNSYYLGVSWHILGSNDGTTWTLLDTRTNPFDYWTSMASDTIVTFDAVSKIKYNTFRMVVSSTGASSVAGVTGLNYFGYL